MYFPGFHSIGINYVALGVGSPSNPLFVQFAIILVLFCDPNWTVKCPRNPLLSPQCTPCAFACPWTDFVEHSNSISRVLLINYPLWTGQYTFVIRSWEFPFSDSPHLPLILLHILQLIIMFLWHSDLNGFLDKRMLVYAIGQCTINCKINREALNSNHVLIPPSDT